MSHSDPPPQVGREAACTLPCPSTHALGSFLRALFWFWFWFCPGGQRRESVAADGRLLRL